MPRVFVINEPLVFDPDTGAMVKKLNLSSAREYGDIVHATPAGRPPLDLRVPLEQLRKSLADFDTGDYLLLIGNPILIAWAAAIAADKLPDGAALKLLDWDGKLRRYHAVREVVFPLDAAGKSGNDRRPQDQETAT